MEKDLDKAGVIALLEGASVFEDDHTREIIGQVVEQFRASRKRILIAAGIIPEVQFELMNEISLLADQTRGNHESTIPEVLQLVGTFERIHGQPARAGSASAKTGKKQPHSKRP